MKRRTFLRTAASATGAAAVTTGVPVEAAEDVRMIKVLDDFAAAWNRHDADALMRHMTEDCVFEASAGKEVAGTRHVGAAAVRAAYAAVWQTYPDAQWNRPRHFVAGDRGVSEWTFTGTARDGAKVEVNGCDIFTFRGEKIAIKNSYRKQRS